MTITMPPIERRSRLRVPLILAAASLLGSYLMLWAPASIQAFWPPLVALVIVFATHRAALGLALAGLCGMLLLTEGHPSQALFTGISEHAIPALTSPWHLGALVFTLLLGAFGAILERGGGLLPILLGSMGSTAPNQHRRRRFLTAVFGLGLVCFFDGLANSLMVGRVARPLADRLRVPRVLLAYLVDTTSSAVACLALVSTWITMQLTLIKDGIRDLPLEEGPATLFFRSIPQNFYCLFALLLAFLTIRYNWLIGPMAKALPTVERSSDSVQPKGARLWRAVLPLLVLLAAIPLFYYFLHHGAEVPPRFPVTLEKITAALNSDAGPLAYVCGSALALLAAICCAPPSIRLGTPRIGGAGAFQLLPSLGVLLLAWILGSVLAKLDTADFLAALLGKHLPLAAFPAALFVVACLTSFVSGTSWGTMALLMPLALPTLAPMAAEQGSSPEALAAIVPTVIAAVLGGSVFGDHCSPFSDTTIVSALSCGVSTPAHTLTQLPYALIAAAASLFCGYLLIALGGNHWLGLLLGGAVLFALVLLLPPRRDRRLPVN